MNPEFLRAVADAILPLETSPPPGALPAPGGSAAGVDLAGYPRSRPVLAALLAASGGESAFLALSPEGRHAALDAVARAKPEEFQALLAVLLPDYYENPAVLTAFGWRSEPPQPRGHDLPDGHDEMSGALGRVKRRPALWRRPGD